MALIQLSSIVGAIRNSVGGQTYSQNKGGAYVKTKPTPTNPRTPAQRAVRANFAANSKQWSGSLTDAQRGAWKLFAQNNPFTNVFGASKVLSGMAMMMKLNQVLSQVGGDFESDAPADLSVLPLAAVLSVAGTLASPTLASLILATDAQTAVSNTLYYVFATGPLSAGKQAGVSDYRFIESHAPTAAATTVDLLTAWTAVFGGNAPVNSHISVLVSTVNFATGAVTPGLSFDTGLLTA